VIVQCKHAEKKKKVRGLDHIIDEYSTKIKKYKAQRAILAFENFEIPKVYLEERKKILRKHKVIIWDDRKVRYYKKVGEALGEWAKYPLLGDFHITKEFGKPISVPAMKVTQGNWEFFVFSIPPEILLKIANVYRREYDVKAYQRMVDSKRIKKEIKKFLEGTRPVFCTNLVCAFLGDVKYNDSRGTLTIPLKYSSVRIIDGQHRLYGFCHVDDSKRSDFNLLCTGFNVKRFKNSYLDEKKQADLFRILNITAKRYRRNC